MRVIPSARRGPCEDDNNSWDAVIVVVDTDAPRRGSDSGVIGKADQPAPVFVAAPAITSIAGGRVGVGTGCCEQAEARGAKYGGASGVGSVDVPAGTADFGWKVGCGWRRRMVVAGRTGVGSSARPWGFSVVVEGDGTCCITLLA